MRGPVVLWSCVSEVTVADVNANAYYNLDAKGRPSQRGGNWEWHASDRDFRVSLTPQWPTDNEVALVAHMPASFFRRGVTTEVRIGAIDRQQSDPTLIDRSTEAYQHHIRVSRQQLSQLAESGTTAFVVAADRSGNVIRSLRLDTAAAAHGETAMSLAADRVRAKIRNFRELCSPLYAGDLDVVIA
ncbi:MAG TPA: hypothetical protein VE989_11365 [Sphingomicrobium sp.]|nr:hypothetical protein [Sphingomicrobium sp.]